MSNNKVDALSEGDRRMSAGFTPTPRSMQKSSSNGMEMDAGETEVFAVSFQPTRDISSKGIGVFLGKVLKMMMCGGACATTEAIDIKNCRILLTDK